MDDWSESRDIAHEAIEEAEESFCIGRAIRDALFEALKNSPPAQKKC